MRVILAYVPVLHAGYRQLFEQYAASVDELCIFGPDLIGEFDHLQRKDPRALRPEDVKAAIEGWGLFKRVRVVNHPEVRELQARGVSLILPFEDETQAVAERYFKGHPKHYDPIFLRWDKSRTLEQKAIEPDRIISRLAFDRKVMGIVAASIKSAASLNCGFGPG